MRPLGKVGLTAVAGVVPLLGLSRGIALDYQYFAIRRKLEASIELLLIKGDSGRGSFASVNKWKARDN